MTNHVLNQPIIDKHEKILQPGGPFSEPSITPDQYDKLMRRLLVLEQKFLIIEKAQYTDVEIREVFDRQAVIERKLTRIDRMLIKIGTKLFRKAISDEDVVEKRLMNLERQNQVLEMAFLDKGPVA